MSWFPAYPLADTPSKAEMVSASSASMTPMAGAVDPSDYSVVGVIVRRSRPFYTAFGKGVFVTLSDLSVERREQQFLLFDGAYEQATCTVEGHVITVLNAAARGPKVGDEKCRPGPPIVRHQWQWRRIGEPSPASLRATRVSITPQTLPG